MADQAEQPVDTAPAAPAPAVEAPAPVEAPISVVAEAADLTPAPVIAAPAPDVLAATPAKAAAPQSPVSKLAVSKPPVSKPAAAKPAVKTEIAAPAPVVAKKVAKPAPAAVKAAPAKAPAPAREVKPAPVRVAKKVAARAVRAIAPKTVSKPTVLPVGKPVSAKPSTAAPRKTFTAPKIAAGTPAPSIIKEKTMAKTAPTDFLASFQSYFAEFQTKAKEAYEKSTGTFGDVNEFAKGNVEAMVESGKILASGLQEMSTGFVTESRSAFDAMTAEVKELATAKSPTEFLSLQSALARKNFDAAVAQASKSTEAMLKLANEVVSPISGRVTMAVEKVGKAA
jgi:hypothetical protein